MFLLGRLVAMLVFFAVCIVVFAIFMFVAMWAVNSSGVSIVKPAIPFVVLYFLAVAVPLFGGDDWLEVTGTYADHEILKLFFIGLPLFFLLMFYFELRYKMPMLVSAIYALACWTGAIAMSFCAILIIVFIGSIFVVGATAKGTLDVATETSKTAKFRCPNCHRGVNAGEDYCPACGTALGENRKSM